MTKILFLYNNLNDIRGISTVMQVAERYARNSGKGNFWVNTKPSPSIKFEEGSVITVMPISGGIGMQLDMYDEVYVDSTINTFMETSGLEQFGNGLVKFYDSDSFKS